MDEAYSVFSPLKKRKVMGKKLNKYLKQLELQEEENKKFEPGKVQTVPSARCKPTVVNFFGDVHTETYCMDCSPSQQQVAVGCANGDIKVYSIYQCKLMLMGNTSRLSGYPNTGIRWNPKNSRELVACNCDGTIKWYDTVQEVSIQHHETQNGYLCVDYNCLGEWTAFGNDAHEIQIFDGETKKMQQKYLAGSLDSLNPNHTNRIFCVKALKNDPNLFFSGGWDGSVRLWDVRIKQTSVRKFVGPMISGDSLDLKENVLLVGNYSTKQTIQHWDFNSGTLIKNIDLKEPSTETLYCFTAAWAHKSKYNLSAVGLSGVNKVKIFQNDQFISQVKFQGSPLCLNFYRFQQKDFLLASGIEGTIYSIKIKMFDR